jgi:hypothetical protein
LNVVLIAQRGRIGYQALLSVASIRAHHPANEIRMFVCIPRNSKLWKRDPGVDDADLMNAFHQYDCETVFIDNSDFGSDYPHGNKFYAILSLPPEHPFMFLDSDTIVTGRLSLADFDFAQPRLKIANPNWPVLGNSPYTVAEIWSSLYEFFGLDPAEYVDSNCDVNSHRCYPYYQANAMYFAEAGRFGSMMLEMAKQLWSQQPEPVQTQPLKPWLDQVVLPLVLAKLGVPRRSGRDPIHSLVIHYEMPMFLMVRYARAIVAFRGLSQDARLMSVIRHDKGFDYFLSEEGRKLVENTYEEFAARGERIDYRAFKEVIRERAPFLR